MRSTVQQVLQCPFHGMAKRMYLESKVWELLASIRTQYPGTLVPTPHSPLPTPHSPLSILLVSLLSSLFVVSGLVFLKSYSPDRVAAQMSFEPEQSLITVMSYESLQEVALGLSFALELKKLYPPETVDSLVRYGFFDRSENYGAVWRSMRQLDQPLSMPLNLWVVASPGMRTNDYPDQLRVQDPNAARRALCPVDPEEFYRIGFPYQLFRCESQRRD